MTYHTIIQIYYNGKLLGQMDKQDSQNIREYWDSGLIPAEINPLMGWESGLSSGGLWMELQDKYQKEYGIDDMLDFVDPEYDKAVKNGREA